MWAAPPNAGLLPHLVRATGLTGPGPLLSRLELGGDPDTDCAWAGSPHILVQPARGQGAQEENRPSLGRRGHPSTKPGVNPSVGHCIRKMLLQQPLEWGSPAQASGFKWGDQGPGFLEECGVSVCLPGSSTCSPYPPPIFSETRWALSWEKWPDFWSVLPMWVVRFPPGRKVK